MFRTTSVSASGQEQGIHQYIPPHLRRMFYKNPARVHASHNGLDPYGFSTRGLVLYLPLWALNNGGTNSIQSVDAHRHTYDITGALWQPDGRRLTGGDDFINIDSALTPLASTTKGTWIIWVKLDDATPIANTFVIGFGDTDAIEFIALQILTTAKLRAQLMDGGVEQWRINSDNAIISDGVYVQLALIQDGTSPIVLVSGVQVAQTFEVEVDKTVWFSDCTGLDNGRLGCINYVSGGNSNFILNGNIGELWFYNRALSVAEALHNYNCTKWRF